MRLLIKGNLKSVLLTRANRRLFTFGTILKFFCNKNRTKIIAKTKEMHC